LVAIFFFRSVGYWLLVICSLLLVFSCSLFVVLFLVIGC